MYLAADHTGIEWAMRGRGGLGSSNWDGRNGDGRGGHQAHTGERRCVSTHIAKALADSTDQQPLLHLLHLGQNPLIRTIRLKPPSPKCIACGPNATITDDLDAVGYEAFCGGVEVDEETGMEVGDGEGRISVQVSCHA